MKNFVKGTILLTILIILSISVYATPSIFYTSPTTNASYITNSYIEVSVNASIDVNNLSYIENVLYKKNVFTQFYSLLRNDSISFGQVNDIYSNLGGFGPEAMGRLGVSQSMEALHPINKVRAFGWGGTSGVEGLLGKSPPLMPTDKITAFTKMNIKSERISGLLGKTPSPVPAVDLKSRMRRIYNY